MTGWEDLAAIGAVTRAMDDLRDFRELEENAVRLRDIRKIERDDELLQAFMIADNALMDLMSKLHQRIRRRESGPTLQSDQ